MKDYRYSDLYFMDSVDKQMVMEVIGTDISIDNSMIEQGSFSLTETLCSQSDLTFGSCEPNYFTVTVYDMPRSIKGETIVVREYLDGNTDDPLTYGVYKVYSDVPTSDRTKREITAYDAMCDIINADMKPWYAGLSFPMTLRQFRDSFFAHMGITQKETTLVNDGMTVNKTLVATQTDSESTITEESTISGKTVIEAICEINGVFGNINRDGEFEYVELEQITNPLYPANDLYPSDDLFPRDPNTISMTGHYITFDYEDFQTKKITQLEIRPADDSAGATVGTNGNNYVVSGNFLVSDKTGTELEAIAANTLSIIRKASYIPIKSSQIVGNPCIELGDPIRFNTTREIVESYVLQRTLTGIQNKRDSIVSPGTETHDKNPNSIIEKISSVQRRTNKLERTADHTLSELADLDANTSSRFEQTAEQIQAEVISRESADSEIKASLTLKIDKTDDGTIVSLISGSANKISFNASNMFTVNSPNFVLDELGNITIGGVIVADTEMYLCYNYASRPGALYSGKVSVLKLDGGTFTTYYVSSGVIISETSAAVGLNTPVLKLGIDQSIQAIITDKQFQAPSIFANFGIFDQIAMGYATGTYGGRVYRCFDSVGDDGIASPGWVKNWAANQGYAKSSDIPSSTYLDNRYMHSKVSGGSDGTGSVFVHAIYYSSGTLTVTTASVSSSDERLKTNVSDMPDLESVYLKFKPKKFRFDDRLKGYDHRWHYGLIAQSVEKDLIDAGIFLDDTGLIWKEPVYDDFREREVINDELVYKLDKDELHAMHIQMIQKQHNEIEQLKQENLALQNRISILEQKMEVLESVINNQNN